MAGKKRKEVPEERVYSRRDVQDKWIQALQAEGVTEEVANGLPGLDILEDAEIVNITDPVDKNNAIDAMLGQKAKAVALWARDTCQLEATGHPYKVCSPIPACISSHCFTGDTLMPGKEQDPMRSQEPAPQVAFQRGQRGFVCSLQLSSGGCRRNIP